MNAHESCNNNQIEHNAKALALSHNLVKKPIRDRLLARLAENEKILIENYQNLSSSIIQSNLVRPATEWLIDNFYLIKEHISIAKRYLPAQFEKSLPQLANGPLKGYPRVYEIALDNIMYRDGDWDLETLSYFVLAYQSVTPLTIGELWAISSMLRLALLENLSTLSGKILADQKEVNFAGNDENEINKIAKEQAADQNSISNSITSLRRLDKTNWREFFENLSVVEHILREDPANIYNKMDSVTRSRYCHMIELLAQNSAHSEQEIATITLKLSALAKDNIIHRHVGFYLIGSGLQQLEKKIHRHRGLLEKIQLLLCAFPVFNYLGLIALISFGLSFTILLNGLQQGITTIGFVTLIFASILATSQLAIRLLDWCVTLIVKPQTLPKMDFSEHVPSQWRTLVVVPAMLDSPEGIVSLLENLEIHFLGNRDTCIHFALLTDFNDASQEHGEHDAVLIELAHKGINSLNNRYPHEQGDTFFLFHRPRHWNASEKTWMGYERKRGKLMHLNSFLRTNTQTLFSLVVGKTTILRSIKYIITLDSDTQLARDSAKQLIGTMAHPLNWPRYDASSGRVIEGYGILQPRIAQALPISGLTHYAKLCYSQAGIDPYTRTVSNVYQDLFNEGSFIGKGIYDVELFEQVLGERLPENRILSHDLLEGCYLRSGLVSDVLLYEPSPSSYLADATRRKRWIRGDWQLCAWLLPSKHLSILSRWKLFDNLRRSLVPVALLVLLSLGWMKTVLTILLLPAAIAILLESLRKPVNVLWCQHLHALLSSVYCNGTQLIFYCACLPHEAWYSLLAIIQTIWRMNISHRHLLEWIPSDQAGRKFCDTLGQWIKKLWISQLIAIIATVVLSVMQPTFLFLASPLLTLWYAQPFLAWWLSRAVAPVNVKLDKKQTRFLHITARKTWAFFETFMNAEDHWLPPDNYQETPVEALAHRTSPTNIGLALLSNLTAYDFGYITLNQLLERTQNTLQTMSGLERYKGHFYNWYNTQTLQPMAPRYISTVDSGNLAGHLLTLRQGLFALINEPLSTKRYLNGLRDTLDVLSQIVTESVYKLDCKSEIALLDEFRKLLLHSDFSASSLKELYTIADQIAAKWTQAHEASIHEWSKKLLLQCRELCDIANNPTESVCIHAIETLARQTFELAQMDMDFLYNTNNHLLMIGYNLDTQESDNSYYDLLASEARLANFVAIAQGALPQKSWFALGRLLVCLDKSDPVLVSWSGSMFEYLMPLLVMPAYEDTLLNQTCHAAVNVQIQYGKQQGVPWGISESGFNVINAHQHYQYRAFGVPGLGLKRGLAKDLVIAPYASVMALVVNPKAACTNLQRLAASGASGAFGFYEAIDFTPSRIPRGKKNAVIRSFMTHHQSMSFLALSYFLHNKPMQKRFIADLSFRSTLLLLQEPIPKEISFYSQITQETNFTAPSHAPEISVRLFENPNSRTPKIQILSNGCYHVMLTQSGAGYSRWQDLAITRWREDGTCDNKGLFGYVCDVNTGDFWSTTYQPTKGDIAHFNAIFSEGHVEFNKRHFEIDTRTEIVVSPEDDIELRRLHIHNRAPHHRIIEFTSYGEIVLAPQAADQDHPAFSNLFVETQILPQKQAILAKRRSSREDKQSPWGVHFITVDSDEQYSISFETQRENFIGRGQTLATPQAMAKPGSLSNTQGCVLDPIFAIRCRITLAPEASISLDLLNGIAQNQEQCIALIDKYNDRHLTNHIFGTAQTYSQALVRQLNISQIEAKYYAKLAAAIVYVNPALRAEPKTIEKNQRRQPALWAYSISGDLPIVLLHIEDSANIDLVSHLVHAHAYWRQKGLAVDLVILNDASASYRQTLQDQVIALMTPGVTLNVTDRAGSIFVKLIEQVSLEDRNLLESIARIIFRDKEGSFKDQIHQSFTPRMPSLASLLISTKSHVPSSTELPKLRQDLLFFNGLGGFTPNGDEYIIRLKNKNTPAPWINILANPSFGTLISESGQASTWIENAQQCRITPWENDPIEDAAGELFYLRDEQTGHFWSPTPLPCRGNGEYETRHGFGYSVFEYIENDIHSELWIYVALDAPIKFAVLKLRNNSQQPRCLSAIGYVEWVLGDVRAKNAMHIVTEITNSESLLAKNYYNADFDEQVAFFNASTEKENIIARTFTGDRLEFLGCNGTHQQPAALKRKTLSGRIGAGFDPCGAIQLTFNLEKEQTREIIFTLGAGQNKQACEALIQRFSNSFCAQKALIEVQKYWKHTLSTVRVTTPNPAFNLLTNGWLLYQVLSARVWGRTAYYQSSGAFGFRDQLQDVMALVHTEPYRFRAHLLLCAAHQFTEGDVQHWWHPHSNRGLRSRCSDDFLWLPFALCHYVETTGDIAILDESVEFISGRSLQSNEESYYDLPQKAEPGTLYQHGVRAILRGLQFGEHGLPLMGSGDWNDGMNLVGIQGKGESIWLGFFLYTVLTQFSKLAQQYSDAIFSQQCQTQSHLLKKALEDNGWDGAWYRRAYFDNGTPLGQISNSECQIDSIAQSWSVLSGAAKPERAKQAMNALNEYLVQKEGALIQLLAPAFDNSTPSPGYIKDYPPGIRENGGQYTHAATWTVMAFAQLGETDFAWTLFNMLNPINHGRTPAEIDIYKIEPYVMAGDVYSIAPHIGRGGWSWYTGSAAWMYRLATESLLGLQLKNKKLYLNPSLPKEWDGFSLEYRYGETLYQIDISRSPNKARIILDGIELKDDYISLIDDLQVHHVLVSL